MAAMPLNDGLFLFMERREQPMHVGNLQIFGYPPEADGDWLASVYESLVDEQAATRLAPLFRRRPHSVIGPLGPWTWQDDPEVDLEHHVRHLCLPRPGRPRELLALTSQIHATLLDRSRPLWESHLIEGVEGGRFAVYSKLHHSVMDGVAGLRLLTRALSTDPDERSMPMAWERRPAERDPTPQGGGDADPPLGWLSAFADLSATALKSTMEVAELGPELGRAFLRVLSDQASHLPSLGPRTILNQPITSARRFAGQSWPMDRVRAVAKATGTTINDVVLAMCGGALRAYLDDLGALPDDPLIALTPVSLRAAGEEPDAGNAIGALLCDLGTDRADPVGRLEAVHSSMEEGKSYLRSLTRAQALFTSGLSMSPMLLGQLPFLRDLAGPGYNVMISNVPGPAEQLYWNGARLDGMYPLSIPTHGQALNITVASYNANLEFGLVGCRRTVPRLQKLLGHLEDALTGLEAAV